MSKLAHQKKELVNKNFLLQNWIFFLQKLLLHIFVFFLWQIHKKLRLAFYKNVTKIIWLFHSFFKAQSDLDQLWHLTQLEPISSRSSCFLSSKVIAIEYVCFLSLLFVGLEKFQAHSRVFLPLIHKSTTPPFIHSLINLSN